MTVQKETQTSQEFSIASSDKSYDNIHIVSQPFPFAHPLRQTLLPSEYLCNVIIGLFGNAFKTL
jgi:hypothetical protein